MHKSVQIGIEKRIREFVDIFQEVKKEQLESLQMEDIFLYFAEAFLDYENITTNLNYRNSIVQALMNIPPESGGFEDLINSKDIDLLDIIENLTPKTRSKLYLFEMIMKKNPQVMSFLSDLSRMDNLTLDLTLQNIIKNPLSKNQDIIRSVKELNEVRRRKESPDNQLDDGIELLDSFEDVAWIGDPNNKRDANVVADVLEKKDFVNTVNNAPNNHTRVNPKTYQDTVYEIQTRILEGEGEGESLPH